MERFRGRKPSPAMVVSIIALVFAIAGSAVASVATVSVLNKKEKKQTRNIADGRINALAPTLSVKSAGSASTAGTVDDGAITAAKIANHAVGGSKLGTIVERTVESPTIATGSSINASVQCHPGEQFLSGGNDGSVTAGYFVVASRFEGPNGWSVFLQNETGSDESVTAHVYCLQ